MKKSLFIAVVGGKVCSPEEAQVAERVGRELARRRAVLLCGGGTGVMEAACRGAYAEGGTTVGILPGNDRSEANAYVNIPIVTGIGYARNSIVVRSAQALIAIGGAYGTLSEIAYALHLDIPIVGLDTWDLFKGGRKEEGIIPASSAEEAVEKAIALAARKSSGHGSEAG